MKEVKNMNKRIIYTAIILLLAWLSFRLLSISNSDFTAISIAPSNSHQTNHINIGDLPADNLSNQFPHQDFLTLIDNQGHESIGYLISKLNEKGITAFESQSITSRLMTSDLKGELLNSNLDSLYALLQFADKYYYYSASDSPYSLLYESIGGYWYNEVANKLSNIAASNSDVKYAFKFRYLDQKCQERNYNVNTGNTKLEKIFLYMMDGKITYLLRRLIFSSSIIIKLLLGLMLFLQAYLVVFFIRKKIQDV
jgi:hypothetical protein